MIFFLLFLKVYYIDPCCIRIVCCVLTDRGSERVMSCKLIIDFVRINVSKVSMYISRSQYSVLASMKQQKQVAWLKIFG